MKEFLVFWVGDGGDRESCSVYYSTLVHAISETEAIDKYFNKFKPNHSRDQYDVLEMEPLKLNNKK